MSPSDFAYESDLSSAYMRSKCQTRGKERERERERERRESSCRADRRRIVIVEVMAHDVLDDRNALLLDEVLTARAEWR